MHPTKDKILETAIDLFSKSSFSAVSIRDITQTVGIKESSLYYHFSSKDKILDSILDIFREGINHLFPPIQVLNSILPLTPPDVFLRQGLHKFKSYICDDLKMSKISRILSTEQFALPKARSIIIDDLYERNIKFLEEVFARYIDLGSIYAFPPRLLATEYQYPVFSMITQYQIMKFDGRDTNEIEKQMDEHVEFFFLKVKK